MWAVSMHPPWSIEMSTTTDPGFMPATMASVTRCGASAPGTSTAPMTRSAAATVSSTVVRFDIRVWMRPLWIESM